MKLIITSTYDLNTEEIQAICGKLGIPLDASVEQKMNPQLIAGYTVEYGSYYVDNSLKGKLQEITESLHL